MQEEIIYFSVNNWFSGQDFPPTENFKKWLGHDLHQQFSDDAWAKENKLCIYFGCIDMSYNYTIAAPRSWVEKNCPELLTDEEFTYQLCSFGCNGQTLEEHKKKYSDFVDTPDEKGVVTARFGWPYLEYKEENFGCHWYDDDEEDDEDDDETDVVWREEERSNTDSSEETEETEEMKTQEKETCSCCCECSKDAHDGLFMRIAERIYNWVNKNMSLVFIIAAIGIICAVVGHYGQMGFNLRWFLWFELPLYMFLMWAIISVWRTYRNFKKREHYDS